MKKTRVSEVTALNRAAFQVVRRDLGSEELMDELLSQVVGGLLGASEPSCTEFTCNIYQPPPPPIG